MTIEELSREIGGVSVMIAGMLIMSDHEFDEWVEAVRKARQDENLVAAIRKLYDLKDAK